MNTPAKPVPNDDEDLGPVRSEAETDGWIARNRDVLNESIAEARRELAEGKAAPWDMDEMIGDLRAEFEKNRQT